LIPWNSLFSDKKGIAQKKGLGSGKIVDGGMSIPAPVYCAFKMLITNTCVREMFLLKIPKKEVKSFYHE
jgi:hypothetical protein